jgi:hypothetical protein
MPETLSLRGNGKLLITAEYLVLKGALALAIPLRFGQSLSATETNTAYISWQSNDSHGQWFSCKFKPASFEILDTNQDAVAAKLIKYLTAARDLNPGFLRNKGLSVTFSANYPLEWGLGSSSSLISILARWAGVNAWELYRMCFTGSGYDLACADNDLPIFYRLKDELPVITHAEPAEALKNYSYFAYLGRKQDSASEVAAFLKKQAVPDNVIEKISALSVDICLEPDYRDLCAKVDEHERIMSEILHKPRLKSVRFSTFPGSVKSLGAWGGDFAMFLSDLPADEVKTSLNNLGIADTIYTFNELIR